MNIAGKIYLVVWITFTLLYSSECCAQLNLPGHIEREIGAAKTAEQKCDRYLEYLNTVATVSPDSALVLEDELIRFYEDYRFVYGVARTKSLKAWHLCFKMKYDESLRLAHEAHFMQKSIGDSLGITLTLARIGITYLQYERYGIAQDYILQSLDRYAERRDYADPLQMLRGSYIREEKPYEAIRYYRRSLNIHIARENPFWASYAYFNLGRTYLQIENMDSAKRYFFKALDGFKQYSHNHKVPAMVYIGLGELYQKLENYPLALQYARSGLHEAEKMNLAEFVLDGKKLVAELLYETEKSRAKQLAYDKVKMKLDSTNNASRLAQIEEQVKHAETETRLATLSNAKLAAENETQSFKLYMLVVIVVSMIVFFGVAIILLRRHQKQKLQQSELNAKISEARMLALRAQMNPHFIFNSINTAQNFIINGQKEKAYQYQSDFARLLRMVLDNSNRVFIPLEDEITQLRLYIQLEETRFLDTFTYTFDIDPELENGVYEIPGMMLQPLVENAIGHGLINRNDAQGKLSVSMKLAEESIICEISDNGVGRNKALEIKAQKKISHQSTALFNINERIRMMQTQSNARIQIEITDLFENGHPAGTHAMVMLPFR